MKFYSEALQESFERAQPILNNLRSEQDAILDDINALELLLKSVHLNQSFTLNLNFRKTPAHHEELLVWDHYKKRIIYTESIYGVSCVAHEKGYYPRINYNDKEIIIETPLAEAPLYIKQRIWEGDKLALFLSFITQKSLT